MVSIDLKRKELQMIFVFIYKKLNKNLINEEYIKDNNYFTRAG